MPSAFSISASMTAEKLPPWVADITAPAVQYAALVSHAATMAHHLGHALHNMDALPVLLSAESALSACQVSSRQSAGHFCVVTSHSLPIISQPTCAKRNAPKVQIQMAFGCFYLTRVTMYCILMPHEMPCPSVVKVTQLLTVPANI